MLILFAILIFVYNFAAVFYQMAGVEPSPLVAFLWAAMFPCAAIWWLRSDARASVLKPLYCQGVLMNVGWFVIIPYHLLRTHGARGFLPLLLLMGSCVLAWITAAVFYLLFFAAAPAH